MNESINKLQLELHVEDFEVIKQYYTALGFKVIQEHPPKESEGYLVIDMNGNTICFWAGNQFVFDQPYFRKFPKDTPRGYGVEIVVMIQDITAFYDRVQSFANVVEPLVDRPWKATDFRAVDPAGYYLRFTSEQNVLDSNNSIDQF